MTLPSIGSSISFSEIQREFGRPTDGKFGNYRISDEGGGDLTNLPLDQGIPGIGSSIRFSDFYSARLNILVDFFSEDLQRQDIKARFDQGGDAIKVIGPRGGSVPESTSGKKIIAFVNKVISSDENSKSERLNCSLLTGEWDPDTELVINIGSDGIIIGAGGDGGRGSEGAGDGFSGKDGTSAIGINTTQNVSIINNGLISCGFGGGGGGKGGSKRVSTGKKSSATAVSSGGGGGGGAGSPVGLGGGKGTGASRGTNGSQGSNATIDFSDPKKFLAGSFGAGGDGDGVSLDGGNGGEQEVAAENGDNSGGSAGNNGFLIVTINGSAPTPTGSGTNVGINSLSTTPT
tara:strand:+ start:224 stop:1261 length:1038 start_codon:yes stop_codon:yes gene_type:complete